MVDFIEMDEEKILPMKVLFEQKIFHKNYETGDMQLDLYLLKLYHQNLFEYFYNNPGEFIQTSKKCLREVFDFSPEKREKDGTVLEASALPKNIINFKIINLNDELIISKIRNKDIKKICKLKGLIKRITKPITRCMSIEYECIDCGTTITVPQDTKKIMLPARCACENKNSKRFRDGKKEIKDIQELSLEEFPEETAGKQPQQIRVYVEGDLTEPEFSERLQPGKRIEVIGIIKSIPPFMNKNDIEENISEFMFYAINVNTLEEEDNEVITDEDIVEIKKIAEKNPLELLSKSLAPSIYGNQIIKEAIVLQLAKGVKKYRAGGSSTKGDINILLSGDPGQAKTVMGKETVLRCPNSRYVSGTRSSGVGLCASLKRDDLLGTWVLEAGAIVLSSGSLVFIDELDKMDKEQLGSLYEPLETQSVTINKAGISASLRAETSILAAANPIKGKFDTRQPLATQIDLPSPLLNRFDLIFILLDKVDEKEDRESVRHLFKIHSGEISNKNLIPVSLFKKYISYIRKLTPKLDPNLIKKVEDLYWDMRKISKNQEGIPMNKRNMEGLIRLAEAHAKIRLSEEVQLEDIEVAERILKFSFNQLVYDESGIFDISRLTEKVPVTKRGKMETVMNLISELTDENKICDYELLKSKAFEKNIQGWELINYLEQLKRENQIYEPDKGKLKIL